MDNPLTSAEVFQLNSVSGGLRPGTISFKTLTLQSDKYVCIRDVQPDGQTSLVIVDLGKRESMRNSIRDAESAIMNPMAKILALRSGRNLQIFDVDAANRLKVVVFNEDVVYWCWIDARTVGIVSNTAVYHWSLDTAADAPPQLVFSRAPEFDASFQVLSYQTDEQKKWLMLCGVMRTAEGMVGKTQLFSVENNSGRVLDGHSGTFISTNTPTDPRSCNLMCLAWNNPSTGGKILIMELPTGSKTDLTVQRRMIDVPFAQGDFPVATHVSPRHKLLTVVTSRGSVVLMDLFTGVVIKTHQLPNNTIFCGTPYTKTGGILCVNNAGSVFHVSPNDNTIVPFVKNQLQNADLALRIAGSANLGGVDDLYRVQLDNQLRAGNIEEAVRTCLRAPNNALRGPDILSRFQLMPPIPGQQPAISTYFKVAVAETTLNAHESAELARAVIPKGGVDYVKQQYAADKLTASEELGDLMSAADPELAIKIYHKAEAHAKVVGVLLQRNETQKAVEYCKRAGFTPNWRVILNNAIHVNPQGAVGLAQVLHRDMGDAPVVDPIEVVDMFVTAQHIQQATEFVLEVLRDNTGENTKDLQTKLLEINLKHSHPSVAEKIFARGVCVHFDAMLLAPLCERASLPQRAIECYVMAQRMDPGIDNLANIRRCFSNAQVLSPDWVIEFFGKLSPGDSMKCLEDLLANHHQNFKIIVQVATKYNEALGADKLINVFLERKLFDILYYYLGAVVPYTRDPEVHFRYIEAAAEVGQVQELERMTRESPCYDPERTKNYLKNKKMTNLWPLINVCDQHNFVDELIRYLIDTNNEALIEQYVQRRNPLKTPAVVGALIDCNVQEDFIKNILNSVGTMCPIAELVDVAEERSRLRLIGPWLEARLAEKKTDTALHNAIAKLLVISGNLPEKFIEENDYYDPVVMGKYCEDRDPNLSYLVYRKAKMSTELVEITSKNGMWKQLARYLVKQQDPALWASVLTESSINRDRLVEAVQQTALPESEVTEEVSTTVKAFMDAELTEELTSILDQIVVRGRFRKNRYLENLLIMSAVRASKGKVMEYVTTLDSYDAKEIAGIATAAELHEEAMTVYDKFEMRMEAATVLLRDLKDLPRGRLYAQRCNLPAVWTVLGEYLLAAGEVREAIEVLIRAKNPNYVDAVTAAAERSNQFGDLVKYLNMARQESTSNDNKIESVLLLTYARTGRLSELEELLQNTHNVQIQPVADKCFEDGYYDSARLLYSMSMNFHKLALTLVRMNNLAEAVDAAQKAQSRSTWDAVNHACIEANDVRLAAICAVPLVLQVESLQDVVNRYEAYGLYDELFAVLKSASTNSGAHMGIFTEMGLQLAKYKPEKLLEHVHMYSKKINAHKLISVCEEYHHWLALRVLHVGNEDWLAAAKTMMCHFADAFDHDVFKDVASHLGASDFVYNAISFYVNTCPQNLCDFLTSMFKVLDPDRVLREVKNVAPIHLILPYLESAQPRNSRLINDALNDLYVEEENFVALRNSVENYNNFDSVELSARLEKMELFEFRKIALFLHRRHKAFDHALAVAKENKLFQEAIDTAVESADPKVVEELLDFFAVERPDSFVSCLYACYDYLSPDVVLEKAWLNNRINIAMPYLIQAIHDFTQRVSRLEKGANDGMQPSKDGSRRGGVPGYAGGNDPLMIQAGPAQPMGVPMHNVNIHPQPGYGGVPGQGYAGGMGNPNMMPY
ncbi:clathrin heavy chain, putative [Trypanosoma brucei gambiense DAL972]|uniref:Clathrin heavy chain n=1 Tax=Trypanosoma brucei gambiense (strain MHOM/CI/86/DAL972) TaxID=679716 RepID=D0A307_TRYB9|nr:clathrin heavy chain, putative [Trypanosoma brucei gambiense DAL972]CBH15651.1 clathrin heavy chain, putative [Trypanosoma brucei gambiense DAL972]|eukprot:XP_011777915.1 clathrin heavy chain, putative [Trypanosoma brucei gambiense DAL972]